MNSTSASSVPCYAATIFQANSRPDKINPSSSSTRASTFSNFFQTLRMGVPNKKLYGSETTSTQVKNNETKLKAHEDSLYCPEGLKKTSDALERPWVKIAITIAVIAAACWFTPVHLAYASTIICKPLFFMNHCAARFLAKIPLIKNLTTTGSPMLQLITGIATMAIGATLMKGVQVGVATTVLSLLSSSLILERIVVLGLGRIFNPKLFKADSYSDALIGAVFTTTVTVPITEEIIFRYVLPYIFKKSVNLSGYVFQAVSGKSCQNDIDWFTRKSTAIFCSVFFGAVHFQNNHLQSFAQALYCGWSGIRIMHPVKEEEGLEASIGEHMANNTIASIRAVVSNFFLGG